MTDVENAPALYHHCVTAYNEMLARSEMVSGECLYQGHLTLLFKQELGYTTPYYSHITRKLKAMGCVRMLKRGGGKQKSIWALITQPTLELFEDSPMDEPYDSRGVASPLERLEYIVRQNSRRILELEKLLGIVSSEEEEEADG